MLCQNTQEFFHSQKEFEISEIFPRLAKPKKKILIVDDDKEITQLLKSILEAESRLEISIAYDPYEAMGIMSEKVFDMVILDWNLPELNGMKTIIETERLFRSDSTLPLEWDGKKAKVITFSSDEETKCPFLNTRHFRYLGHIHKKNSLSSIMEKIGFYLNLTLDVAV